MSHHSCDPEFDLVTSGEREPLPTISCPHSLWLDSCKPRPFVSMGKKKEARAASRQQPL